MKLQSLLLLLVAAFSSLLPRPAEARVEVSFDFFFDALSPHGEWIEVGDYGTCWRPAIADADWRPYSDGYWSYTDGGWTWVSYEEFGGIVYHYGRWVDVDGEGWCWVPDYEWAPAWVSWRTSDDYIGWAPLPPEARWRRNTGFSVWVDNYYDIGPARFNFCRVRDFGAPYLRPVIVNRFENVTIIQHTANVTNITYFDSGDFGGLVHCGGPSFAFVNQHVYRPIPALKLIRKTQINNITNINVQNLSVFNAEPRGNALAVLVPQVTPPTPDIRRPQPVRSIPAARIRKGWDGVKDPEVASVIRTRMQQESRGLTPDTAPARKVQAAELKVVPTQVDTSAPSPLRTARQRGNETRRGEGAPTAIVQPPTQPQPQPTGKSDAAKPVDARAAERMARDAARQTGPAPVQVVPAVPPAGAAEKAVAEQKKNKDQPQTSPAAQAAERDARSRQMTRSVPSATPSAPAVAPGAPFGERSPSTAKPNDDANAARARAQATAAEQERAATEQRLRAAAQERERAAEAAMRRQREAAAQQEATRERLRREMPAPTVRRSEPTEPPRSKPDDSARQAAEAAAVRQRQMESARSQQMENARREAAAENARRSQMESARREQAAQAARQQQMESARREQAAQSARQQQMENARREQATQTARQQQMESARREQASQAARQQQMENARREATQENARRAQMESARREQAAASARQAEASRQMEAARQAQQRSESSRREPAPQRYGPPPTQSRDRSEEADAIRKGRNR